MPSEKRKFLLVCPSRCNQIGLRADWQNQRHQWFFLEIECPLSCRLLEYTDIRISFWLKIDGQNSHTRGIMFILMRFTTIGDCDHCLPNAQKEKTAKNGNRWQLEGFRERSRRSLTAIGRTLRAGSQSMDIQREKRWRADWVNLSFAWSTLLQITPLPGSPLSPNVVVFDSEPERQQRYDRKEKLKSLREAIEYERKA